MYSNVFDTVNTETTDRINFEGLLYTSILSGNHPTLSLSQVIDSGALLAMLENDQSNHFLRFIKKGYIRVALYGKLCGNRDEIICHLSERLDACAKNPDVFIFSGLPFLYENNRYKERLPSIFKNMNYALLKNKSFGTYLADKAGMGQDNDEKEHISQIDNYLSSVRKIEHAVRGQYVLPRKSSTVDIKLYKRFLKYSSIYIREVDNSEYSESMKELKARVESQIGKPGWEGLLDSRSFLYKLLSATKCSSDANKELKAIIDLCYNEKVAASIVDNESDIMVNNSNLAFTQIYSERLDQDDNLDKVDQKLELVKNSRYYSKQIYTWELLDQIIQNVESHITKPDEWYDCVQRYCGELAGQELRIKRERIFKGILNFMVTSLTDNSLRSISDRLIQDSDFKKIGINLLIDAVICLTSGTIKHIVSKADNDKKDIDSDAQQRIIKELLTQTSLLKKDYNNDNDISDIDKR